LRSFSAKGDPRWLLSWFTQLEESIPNIHHLSIDIPHLDMPQTQSTSSPSFMEQIRPMVNALKTCSKLHTISFGCSGNYRSTTFTRETRTFSFGPILQYLKAPRQSLQRISIGEALFVDSGAPNPGARRKAIWEIFDTFPQLEEIKYPNGASIPRTWLVPYGWAKIVNLLLNLDKWSRDASRLEPLQFVGKCSVC
jgi:hypothetical protein